VKYPLRDTPAQTPRLPDSTHVIGVNAAGVTLMTLRGKEGSWKGKGGTAEGKREAEDPQCLKCVDANDTHAQRWLTDESRIVVIDDFGSHIFWGAVPQVSDPIS